MDDRIPARIANRIIPCLVCGCWWYDANWTSGNGYSKLSFEGVTYMAHRFIYEKVIGPIPVGMIPDHQCRMRACVNPHHLRPMTIRENTLIGDAVLFGDISFTERPISG